MSDYIDEEVEERVTKVWKDYQAGLDYQQRIRLPERIKQNVAFYEGDQWAKPTEKTMTLPRPVVNIIKMIVRAKTSAMNNTPVRIVFEADSNDTDTQDFTHFAEYIFKEMGMAEIDAQAVRAAGIKGGYFYHFYWDNEATGKKGNLKGAVRCDLINPKNIFFENPAQLDEQKQKWIIVSTREEIDAVREQADPGVDKDLITEDERGEDFDDREEQEGTKMCTVLTRYFKKGGEVFCEKATKQVVFKKAFSIAPDMQKAKQDLGYDEDAANTDSPDEPKKAAAPRYKACLYPIAVGQYEYKEDCIYGMSEVEGLIPNQKCINFNLAMILLQQQQMAWGKWIVSKDALKGQQITNEPGQVITDNTPGGNGIKQVQGGQMSAMPLTLIDNLLSYTRTVAGSTEVMTGELASANMSGAAIAQLQAQAHQPIEELRDGFWRVKEKQGRILEQFFRLFYQDETIDYSYREHNDETDENELKKVQFDVAKYADVDFTVVAKAGTGTRSSTAGDITFLDNLLKAQAITIMQYAESYPEDALSDKASFLKLLKKNQEDELTQTKRQLEEVTAQHTQALTYLDQVKKIIASASQITKENEQLKGDIVTLYKELCKYQDASVELAGDNEQLYNDASMFAQELAKAGFDVGGGNQVNIAPKA